MLSLMILFVLVGEVQTDSATLMKTMQRKLKEKQAKIKDIVMVQEDPELGEIVIMSKGAKMRQEMNMPVTKGKSVKTIIIFDSLEYWMISELVGKRKLSSKDAKKYGREEIIPDVGNGEIVGEEDFMGKSCYVIKVKLIDEKDADGRFWMDKETLDILKTEVVSGKDKITTVYSDFRIVGDGISLPFKREMFTNGKVTRTPAYKDIKVNSGLSDDLFNADKVDVKHMSPQEMFKIFE